MITIDDENKNENENLTTIVDFIRWGASIFNRKKLYFGHGTTNAFDESRLLVFHVLELQWDLPDIYLTAKVSLQEQKKILELFEQRIKTRKPAAYLTGESWFSGLKFYVNESTLVPRSPFAEIILTKFQDWVEPCKINKTLDMCTGSGCIGIAALQVLSNSEVDLVDISSEALKVAQKNIEFYQLENRAKIIKSDLFANLHNKKYDLILANPPYVDKIEMEALEPEFKSEPSLALDGGKDGLDIVNRLLAESSKHLTKNGVLMIEVGVSRYYLEKKYPELPLYWFEFENGGEGICAINKPELDIFCDLLKNNN